MQEVEWNRYMRSHKSGNIHDENLHIWAVERKKSFLKKNTTITRTYWATKRESRSENEFWATCHNISNLSDRCWHPLLEQTLNSVELGLVFQGFSTAVDILIRKPLCPSMNAEKSLKEPILVAYRVLLLSHNRSIAARKVLVTATSPWHFMGIGGGKLYVITWW